MSSFGVVDTGFGSVGPEFGLLYNRTSLKGPGLTELYRHDSSGKAAREGKSSTAQLSALKREKAFILRSDFLHVSATSAAACGRLKELRQAFA